VNEPIRDHIDAAIDRAARQIVERDPPPAIYAAVASEIRAAGRSRPEPWLRWSLVAVSTAALLILAVALWNQLRQDLQHGPHAPKAMVAQAPARTDAPTRSSAAASVRIRRERRRAADVDTPAVSDLAAAITPIKIRQIPVESLEVPAIPFDPVAMRAIQIADIALDPR
jgi:cytoskeletal protein RodZ